MAPGLCHARSHGEQLVPNPQGLYVGHCFDVAVGHVQWSHAFNLSQENSFLVHFLDIELVGQ